MLQRHSCVTGVVWYASPLLQHADIPHAFSTRVGGVSSGPFRSLNLGNPHNAPLQDDPANIRQNYARVLRALGLAGRQLCRVHQVHGRRAVWASADARDEQADALLTDDPALILSVRIADCVPVLLATRDGRRVAAVHAGWRGVVAGVVPEALRHLSPEPQTVLAAIGPCISLDAFEVGPEVLQAFQQLFEADAPIRPAPDGKGHVDLRQAVRLQLLAAGLQPDHIDSTDRCTFQHADEFFSHRRDQGLTGRQAALIATREEKQGALRRTSESRTAAATHHSPRPHTPPRV